MSDFELIVPLLSLIDEAGQPIEPLISAHLKWLFDHGIRHILALGSTGEFPSFSVAQRHTYLAALVQHNPGMDIMVNIGASALRDIEDLQLHALKQLGVTSLLWMPPFYFPDTQINGLSSLLGRLLSHQPEHIPLYGYHHPKMSQVSITPTLMAEHPKLAGIKDTSGDFERMTHWAQQFPDKKLYVGTDTQITKSKVIGAQGIIPGMSNLFPALYLAAIQGNAEAESTLQKLRPVFDGYCKLPAMKAYLNHLHLAPQTTHIAPPFAPLSQDFTAALIADCTQLLESTAYAHPV